MTALLAVTAYVTLQLTSANSDKQQKQQEVTRSLAFAKDALIAYAVNYVDNYGHNVRGGVGRLPCPATIKYGSPARSCGRHSIGYLPGVWSRAGKRMDIDHLEKFLDQDLWYAVSADYRYNPAFNSLNSNPGANPLAVDGDDQVVAVIFAPGDALPNQPRVAGSFSITDYLEGENANGDNVFSAMTSGNDRLVTITRSELLALMERKVLGYTSDWLREYKTRFGHYPYAAPFGDPQGACQQGLLQGMLPMQQGDCQHEPLGMFLSQYVPRGRTINQIWFQNYSWSEFIYYHVDENCTVASAIALCDGVNDPPYSLTVNSSPVQALLVSVGEVIDSSLLSGLQQRVNWGNSTAIDLLNYFDTVELINPGLQYNLQHLDAAQIAGINSNDQYLVIP